MNANGHESVVTISAMPFDQIRNCAEAINAGVIPEVNQDYLPAKGTQREGIRVEPKVAVNLGRAGSFRPDVHQPGVSAWLQPSEGIYFQSRDENSQTQELFPTFLHSLEHDDELPNLAFGLEIRKQFFCLSSFDFLRRHR